MRGEVHLFHFFNDIYSTFFNDISELLAAGGDDGSEWILLAFPLFVSTG
jgi:hypothetical protein